MRLDRFAASAAAWVAGSTGWRRAGLALLAGAVSALALPPLHVLPLLWLTVPALLVLIGAARRALGAAMAGFWFGFGMNLVGLYWITEAILFESARFWWLVPLAVPALSVVMAVFVAIPCAIAWLAAPGWRRVAALAGAWVLADVARQFMATGFPWNPLGSVWAVPGRGGDAFLQLASVIGVHGLTLLTLLIAATPWLGRGAMFLGVFALAAWGGFGNSRLAAPQAAAPGVTVVVVQGAIPQGRKWDRAFVLDIFQRYLDLTREGAAAARAAAANAPIIVLWPETASPFQLQTDAAARAAIADAAGPGATVLAGAVRFDTQDRPRNSLFALAGGAAGAIYDKWHLVPFGEYQPNWLPIPIQIVPGGGFARGPGPRTMALPGLPPAGPLICYEAIFPAQIVESDHRPGWLANVTNDAWFGNSSGPRQHLAAARLRAVEEGLPLVRAANTGISAVFDARGHELGRLAMQRIGTLVLPLPAAGAPTLAARAGLLIPLGLAGVLLAAALARRSGPSRGGWSQKR